MRLHLTLKKQLKITQMKLKTIISIHSLFLLMTPVLAQEKYTISGYIKDAETGEHLIGALLYGKAQNFGVATNAYGFYSFTLPKGTHEITCSFMGYEPQSQTVTVNRNLSLSIDMKPAINDLDEIIVSDKRANENVTSASMGVVKLNPKEIKSIAVVFGEQDILKTIQLLPGVRAGTEGGTGFHVRGGSSDQNLILLDEAPVYNAGHLMGFFSVFNSDAISDFTLFKGNAPAAYGGRLSSVLDVRMKEGNSKKTAVSGGIGTISSRLTVETPIVKNKGSFIISGRRTYVDLFLKLSDKKSLKNTRLYFYDLNAKANYKINENNRLFLSGYFGRDVFKMVQVNNSGMRMNFGNITASARWNHVFNGKKLFSNTTLIYSNYSYKVGVGTKNISSTITDYNLKEDFTYYINPSNTLKFGFNVIHHTFSPGEITTEGSTESSNTKDKYAFEGGAYILNDVKLSDKINLNYGLRYSMFSLLGPGTVHTYDKDGELLTTKVSKNGEVIQTYSGFEPRITSSFIISENNSIKASYARNMQYVHLVSNSTSSSNFEVWQPSTLNVKPEIADQYSIGYFKNLKSNKYETSVEVYYKDLQNQIEYRDGANVLFSSDIESEYTYGKGTAYGIECYLRKKEGRLTGWMSYTLGKSERKFDEINNGKVFPTRHDRTHDFSIVAIYQLTKRLSASASWVFYTGNAVTYPRGRYVIEGYQVPYYSNRNADRMPNYHRLDLSLTLEGKKRPKYHSSWNFAIYNAYMRENPYTITFREDENNTGVTKAYQTSMFSIVPSITYNFNF